MICSLRINAEPRDRDGEGEMMFGEYKTGVEEELERIFERIVEQFRDRSHHSGRYKRDTEHDVESRRRKVGKVNLKQVLKLSFRAFHQLEDMDMIEDREAEEEVADVKED